MTEDWDKVRSEVIRAAVRGWEANLDERPPAEQALTRAVLISHFLLIGPAEPPEAQRLEEAAELLASVEPGLFATWESSRGTWVRTGTAEPALVVDAFWQYLLQAMGTHDPRNLRLSRLLADLLVGISTGGDSLEGAELVLVARLLYAAHAAECGYLEMAAEAVAQVIDILPVLAPRFPGILPVPIAACREARQQLLDAQPGQARLKRWQIKQENKAKKLAERADEISVRGAHERARKQIDEALEIQRQIAGALPGTPSTLELDAWLHGMRASIMLRSGEARAALEDAERSLHGYERLTTMDPEQFATDLDIAHRTWVDATIAAAKSPRL